MPRHKTTIYKHQDRFICDYCSEYETSNKKGLYLHLKYTHGVEKATQNPTIHVCNTCKKVFTKNINVLNHIRKTHM